MAVITICCPLIGNSVNIIDAEKNYNSFGQNEIVVDDLDRAIFYWNDYQYDSAKYYFKAALISSSHPEQLARAEFGLGLYYVNNSLIKECQKQIAILETFSDNVETDVINSYIYGLKAKVSMYNDLKKCEEYFNKSIALLDRNDPLAFDIFIYYIDFLTDDRQFDKAESLLLKLSHNTSDNYIKYSESPVVQYRIQSAKAYLSYKKGQYNTAIATYENILDNLSGTDHWKIFAKAKCFKLLSYPYRKSGLFDKAYQSNINYLELRKKTQNLSDMDLSQVFSEITRILELKGNYILADEFKSRLVDLISVSNNSKSYFYMLLLDAARLVDNAEYYKAIDIYRNLEVASEKMGLEYNKYYLPTIYLHLSNLYFQIDIHSESLKYFYKFNRLPDVDAERYTNMYFGIFINYLKIVRPENYNKYLLKKIIKKLGQVDSTHWQKYHYSIDLINELASINIRENHIDSAKFFINKVLDANPGLYYGT
ncbi:MAG: hypothetical protein WBA74_15595, partial [Cyclobacteriaceae bacterium]